MKKNRHKRCNSASDVDLTKILVGIVVFLALLLAVLVTVTFCLKRTGSRSVEEPRQQSEASGLLTESMENMQTETEGASEDQTDMQEKTEQESEQQSGTERLTEKESETGQLAEKESETGQLTEKESETGQLAEKESETETETETETEYSNGLTVAIDPGHQGSWVDMSALEPDGPGSSTMKAKSSTGTQGSFSGKKEYELNLEISLLLRDILEERGYRVVLTREDHDTAISNSERATMAWEEGGDVYVRIHANGSDSFAVQGALAMVPSPSNQYVSKLAEDSYLLGSCILEAYCQNASFQNLGVQYYDNMSGINWSRIPVMILEMGFMTNQSDDLRMADASVQPLMAEGIANGIDRYFTEKGLLKTGTGQLQQTWMDGCLEQLGENYIYPWNDQGENWAVSLADLNTGASGGINGDRQFRSASVIKAFLMAAIYDRVCYPSSEDRRLYISESYDGELKQLITDMITVSDNTAANTLLERLGGGDAQTGMAVVNQFCQENGYSGTSFGRLFLEENPSGDNLTTANDCMRLLESIYQGSCVNAEASAKMYEYLKQQTRTGKIPQGIPDGAALTANKTGELAGEYGCYVENDIAIVDTGDHAYVLCVLSENLQDNGTAQARIRELSGFVYGQAVS